MIQEQFASFSTQRRSEGAEEPSLTPLPNGGHLVRVPQVNLRTGWSQPSITVLFVAPPGYPAAQPDCFWAEPDGLRLANGGTPQNSNDSNPIPGDIQNGRKTTWFSWHLQGWDPNRDNLQTFFNVILRRLDPAR